MGTIKQILNKVNCGAGALLGTGGKFCVIDIDTPKLLALTQKGMKVPSGTAFDLDYVKELQQKEQAYVFKGVVNFADNTPENTLGTYDATGEKYLQMKSPYEMTFTFDRGLYSYKALTKFESNGLYDIWIFDVANNMFCALDSTGAMRGLDAGLVTIGKYGIGKDNSQTMTVQIDRSDFDDNVAWITKENLGFSASQDLDGYNDVTVVLTTPVNLDTTIKFSVSANANNKTVPLEGLLITDLYYTVDGASVSPTSLSNGINPGEYVLTVPTLATAKVLTLQLKDSVLPANIINLDGTLYKSDIGTTIVL